jgi:hypothetical protein
MWVCTAPDSSIAGDRNSDPATPTAPRPSTAFKPSANTPCRSLKQTTFLLSLLLHQYSTSIRPHVCELHYDLGIGDIKGPPFASCFFRSCPPPLADRVESLRVSECMIPLRYQCVETCSIDIWHPDWYRVIGLAL